MKNYLVILFAFLLTSCASNNINGIDAMIEKDNRIVESKIADHSNIIEEVNSKIISSKNDFISEKNKFKNSLENYLAITSKINADLYMGISPEEGVFEELKSYLSEGNIERKKLEGYVDNMKGILSDLDKNKLYFNYLDSSIDQVKSFENISDENLSKIKNSEINFRRIKTSNFMISAKMKRDIVRYISLLEKENILYQKLNSRMSKGGYYELPRHEIKTEVVVFKKNQLNKSKKINKKKISNSKATSSPIIKVENFSSKNKINRKEIFNSMNGVLKTQKNSVFRIKVISSNNVDAMDRASDLIIMLSEMGLSSDRMSVQTEVRGSYNPVVEIYNGVKRVDSAGKIQKGLV
ncbi:MAG: hypothetical protein N4A44_02035 [Alphaproteobacteria bacterium]|jgi:hypothetical protein|nr:hypothetical protein [Alphaproteobacteria bacterium]